jgi:hypothetical protein
MSEHRPLLMRSNRLLGSALIEHNLVRFEDLEAANERLLEIAAGGDMRRSSVLNILAYETKVLKEEDLLHHVVDDHGLGVIDLRGYEVPEEVKAGLDLGACWATWTVPFDKEEDFHFVATAYYLNAWRSDHLAGHDNGHHRGFSGPGAGRAPGGGQAHGRWHQGRHAGAVCDE